MRDVVDAVEGEQDEIESLVGKLFQVARVAAQDGRVLVLPLHHLDEFRRVVDPRVVLADLQQVLRRPAAADGDVQNFFIFNLRRQSLQQYPLRLVEHVKIVIVLDDIGPRVCFLINVV
jgi:hypothetical protein